MLSRIQESEKLVILLDDDEPEAVEAMLLFLYTFENPGLENMNDSRLCDIVDVAEKYGIHKLKSLVYNHLLQRVQSKLPELETMSPELKRGWASALADLWTEKVRDGDGIKKAAIEVLPQVVDALLQDAEAKKLLLGNMDLAADLLSAMAKRMSNPESSD